MKWIMAFFSVAFIFVGLIEIWLNFSAGLLCFVVAGLLTIIQLLEDIKNKP